MLLALVADRFSPHLALSLSWPLPAAAAGTVAGWAILVFAMKSDFVFSATAVASGPFTVPRSVSAANRPATTWARTAKIKTTTMAPPAGLWPAS